MELPVETLNGQHKGIDKAKPPGPATRSRRHTRLAQTQSGNDTIYDRPGTGMKCN